MAKQRSIWVDGYECKNIAEAAKAAGGCYSGVRYALRHLGTFKGHMITRLTPAELAQKQAAEIEKALGR